MRTMPYSPPLLFFPPKSLLILGVFLVYVSAASLTGFWVVWPFCSLRRFFVLSGLRLFRFASAFLPFS
jgi:hypothetical protein